MAVLLSGEEITYIHINLKCTQYTYYIYKKWFLRNILVVII